MSQEGPEVDLLNVRPFCLALSHQGLGRLFVLRCLGSGQVLGYEPARHTTELAEQFAASRN